MTPIDIALLEDLDAYIEHIQRHMRDNGRDGIYFSPFSSTYRRDPAGLKGRLRPKWEKSLQDLGWERAFIIWDGDRIVGHLDLERETIEPAGHRLALSMGLEYGYKGRGLGSRLMEEAIGFAKTLDGIEWIDLGVFSCNQPAQALYKKFGFVETGRVEDNFRVDGRSLSDIQMSLRTRREG